MGSAATTRRARTSAGKCAVCLRRAATAGHPTCPECREAIAIRSAERYRERRRAGQCVRCGEDADGYLCETHAAERRRRRAA